MKNEIIKYISIYLYIFEAFAMVMSFFCKESTAHFGIEYGYDLLNLIPVCILESTLTKVFQD